MFLNLSVKNYLWGIIILNCASYLHFFYAFVYIWIPKYVHLYLQVYDSLVDFFVYKISGVQQIFPITLLCCDTLVFDAMTDTIKECCDFCVCIVYLTLSVCQYLTIVTLTHPGQIIIGMKKQTWPSNTTH